MDINMQNYSSKPLGLQYNEFLSQYVELTDRQKDAEKSLATQINSEKNALAEANKQIDTSNSRYSKYANALRQVWSDIFNQWSHKYTANHLRQLSAEIDSLKQKKSELERDLNLKRAAVDNWGRAYSRFYSASSSWLKAVKGYWFAYTGKGCLDWAVAAGVTLVFSRTNYVIRMGGKKPDLVFVKDESLRPTVYDLFYKFTHPFKYQSIKNTLKKVPPTWDEYIRAAAALEIASKPLGYKFLANSSRADAEVSDLERKMSSIDNDINEKQSSYRYAESVYDSVKGLNSGEEFINKYDFDTSTDYVKNTAKGLLLKILGSSETETVMRISLNPSKLTEKIRGKENEVADSYKVKELRRKANELKSETESSKKTLQEIVNNLTKQFPLMLALCPNISVPVDEDNVVRQINHKTLECLLGSLKPNSDCSFIEWQSANRGSRSQFNYNLHPMSGKYGIEQISAVLNRVVASIIGTLTPGSIKVTFVDLDLKGLHKKHFSRLIDDGIATCIINNADFLKKIELLQQKKERIYNSLAGDDDVFAAYRSGKTEPDYELLIIYGAENVECNDSLKDLIQKGAEYGISVFGLSFGGDGRHVREAVSKYLKDLYIDTGKSDAIGESERIINAVCAKVSENYRKNIERGTRWTEVDTLINEFPKKLKAGTKVWTDATQGLSVPIGRRLDNKELDYYEFNPEKGQHLSLVIGSTGSGKSVFLHDIITNLMLKYSPNQVHLHLMDFKDSGLELQDYKGAPHVHTLLLDGGDLDMAAAILRNLKGEIGEISRKLGRYKNIMDYNKNNPTNPLPFNIFIVDECQELFRNSSNTPKAVEEIREIIGYIAQQGRATGFGFVLATQTRIGLQFPRNAETQLNNVFMLKCSTEDAQNLFPNDKIDVPKYHVYHKDANNHGALSKVFINNKTVVVNGRETECLHTQMLREKGGFNFKDQFCYDSGMVREITENIVRMGYNDADAQSPVLALGHRLDVEYSNMPVELSFNSMNGNLLVSGVNKEGQTDRIMLNSLCSLSKYNPSNAKVYVLNGNTSGTFSTNLKKQIDRFGRQRKCVFKGAEGQHQNKDLIAELYAEFARRKAQGRMGDDNVSYQPIVVAVMNSDRLITSLYESDKFTLAKFDNQTANSSRTSMNTEDSNLLARIKGQSPQTTGAGASSGPFRKFDSMSNFGSQPASANAEISYGAAYAQLLANGSVYHIHFIIQKNTASSQFVPDFASRYVRSKAEEIFMTRIMVARNDMSLERTSVMLDCNIDHLRVYFQEAGVEPEVMVPYVMSPADSEF